MEFEILFNQSIQICLKANLFLEINTLNTNIRPNVYYDVPTHCRLSEPFNNYSIVSLNCMETL